MSWANTVQQFAAGFFGRNGWGTMLLGGLASAALGWFLGPMIAELDAIEAVMRPLTMTSWAPVWAIACEYFAADYAVDLVLRYWAFAAIFAVVKIIIKLIPTVG